MAHDVFISHSSKDKTVADAVCAVLESNGVRCWISPRDVMPSVPYAACIVEAIEQCRIMVLVFTMNANNSPHIAREIERAANQGKAILPLRVEDVVPARGLDYFIGNVHWLDALTPPLESHLKNLASTVKMLLAQMPQHFAAVTAEPEPAAPTELLETPPPESTTTHSGSKLEMPAETVAHTSVASESRVSPTTVRKKKSRWQLAVLLGGAILVVGIAWVVNVHENEEARLRADIAREAANTDAVLHSDVYSRLTPAPPKSSAPVPGNNTQSARSVAKISSTSAPVSSRNPSTSDAERPTPAPPAASAPPIAKETDSEADFVLIGANKGDAKDQYLIGVRFYLGREGETRDYSKAVRWFRLAAEQGNRDAEGYLGFMYENGTGINQDYEQALAWNRKAVEQGLASSQYNLGDMYDRGVGVPQNYAAAFDLYRKAADQGSASAQDALGDMYLYGHSVPQNDAQAFSFYQKAADQGLAVAQSHLGSMYYAGDGVMKNYAQAAIWTRKSADQGDSTAQNNLGFMYEYGDGVDRDYVQALFWFQKAANQGHSTAQLNLGALYEQGLGVPKDLAQARAWYKKAADQGDLDAQKKLKSLGGS